MRSDKKILLLFVRYGVEDYPGSLSTIVNHFKGISNSVSYYIIENDKNFFKKKEATNNLNIVIGSNLYNEFSAWQSVIDMTDLDAYDVVVLATSAFSKNYKGGNWSIHTDITSKTLDYISDNFNVVAGQLDCSDRNLSLNNYTFNSWLRSNLLIFNSQLLKKINIYDVDLFNSCNELNSTISDCEDIFKAAGSSETYKEYVLKWLSGETINGGVWSTPYEMDRERFRKKVMMIIFEHMLSIRLRFNGVSLIDIVMLELNTFKNSFDILPELLQIDCRRKLYPDS